MECGEREGEISGIGLRIKKNKNEERQKRGYLWVGGLRTSKF